MVKKIRPNVRLQIPTKADNAIKDPVAVFCRIRPPDDDADAVFAVPVPPNKDTGTLKLTPPISSFAFRNGSAKEQLYKFRLVFPQEATQKRVFDEVAKPLISDLLNGKNGLLIAYGITGSGKTYTMEGSKQDGGIVRRAVDVIFNSINDFQAHKYVFKPDKMNGFETQSESDALEDKHRFDILPSSLKTPGRVVTRSYQRIYRKDTSGTSGSSDRIPDSSRINVIDEDNVYAVFVSCIEIYNNYVYDLLEEFSETNMTKNLQSKILREDAKHNMYVHGCTEVEVKTPGEAFEVLYRGQKQRKVAHTRLNCESSRSHSVFTIRVVQAPLDEEGEEVVADKSCMLISQLSLVDLAGSERTTRTKATGDRLKEAGNINTSLLALRQCIEALRENQKAGGSKKVPYRDSKLTHYFRNFFEGEGSVRMIVCVNPSPDNYDETLPVMKFAELAAEVQIHCPPTVKCDLGLTPGRRRANLIYKEARKRLREEVAVAKELDVVDLTPVYSLGANWPFLQFSPEVLEENVHKLTQFLRKRIAVKEKFMADLEGSTYEVVHRVEGIENENTILREKVKSIQASYDAALRKLKEFEGRLLSAEEGNESLQRKFHDYNSLLDEYNRACEERDLAKCQGELDKQRLKTRLKTKLEAERERMVKDMNAKLHEQQCQLKTQMIATQVKALQEMCDSTSGNSGVSADTLTQMKQTPLKTRPDPKTNEIFPHSLAGPAVYNPRHRRSVSQGANMWLDHRPTQVLDPGTVLQPNMPRRRPVRRLKSGDLLDAKKVSHYCLTTQRQDSEGELETKLYKGDILPTVGGGAQVIFQDVEILQQRDPLDVANKRLFDGTPKAERGIGGQNDGRFVNPYFSSSAKKPRK